MWISDGPSSCFSGMIYLQGLDLTFVTSAHTVVLHIIKCDFVSCAHIIVFSCSDQNKWLLFREHLKDIRLAFRSTVGFGQLLQNNVNDSYLAHYRHHRFPPLNGARHPQINNQAEFLVAHLFLVCFRSDLQLIFCYNKHDASCSCFTMKACQQPAIIRALL